MSNNSPASTSVSEEEAQANKRQVPSDDDEISSEDPGSSRTSSNATSRSRWQDYKVVLSFGIVFMIMVASVLALILLWVGMSGSSNADDMPPCLGMSDSSNADDMPPVLFPGFPTIDESIIDETPRFRSPDFAEELIRNVVGVDPLPGTPQLDALEWMASDDLELWDYETISVERLKQRYALAVFHIATGRWNTRGGWATTSGARQHECYWPGVYCDRNNHVVLSLRLDTFVGILQGSIPSDIFLLSNLGTYSRSSSDLLLSIDCRISPPFIVSQSVCLL
jgi:hypothetical protein